MGYGKKLYFWWRKILKERFIWLFIWGLFSRYKCTSCITAIYRVLFSHMGKSLLRKTKITSMQNFQVYNFSKSFPFRFISYGQSKSFHLCKYFHQHCDMVLTTAFLNLSRPSLKIYIKLTSSSVMSPCFSLIFAEIVLDMTTMSLAYNWNDTQSNFNNLSFFI